MIDLRDLRLAQDIRLIDAGDVIGVTERTLMNWEKGVTIPTMSLDQFAQMASLYKCSLDDLVLAIRESGKGDRKGLVWEQRASKKPRKQKQGE